MSLCGNNNPCPDLITGQKCGITYTGARYVPLFADPAEWTSANAYEPLTIVIHEGNSYTSKTFVPVGVDISNEKYWALTGNYNAQVEAYRKEVQTEIQNRIESDEIFYKRTNNLGVIFDNYDDMINNKSNDWERCIVKNGKTVPRCIVDHPVEFVRITKTSPEFPCLMFPVLSNGDKAKPLSNFRSITNNFEGNLSAISYMLNNPNYRYQANSGIFMDTIFTSDNYRCGQCSNFVYSLLVGLTENNSRWIRGANSNNILNGKSVKMEDTNNPSFRNGYTSANGLAYDACVNGYGYEPVNIEDIKIGDCLFFESLENSPSSQFLRIDHCSFVVGVDISTSSFQVVEWGGASSSNLNTSKPTSESPHFTSYDFNYLKNNNIIKYGARFPLNNSVEWNEQIHYTLEKNVNVTSYNATQVRRGLYCTINQKMTPGKLYKFEFQTNSGSNIFYPALLLTVPDYGRSVIGVGTPTYGGKIEMYFVCPENQTSEISVYLYSLNNQLTDFTVSVNNFRLLSVDNTFETFNPLVNILSPYSQPSTSIINNIITEAGKSYIYGVASNLTGIPANSMDNPVEVVKLNYLTTQFNGVPRLNMNLYVASQNNVCYSNTITISGLTFKIGSPNTYTSLYYEINAPSEMLYVH